MDYRIGIDIGGTNVAMGILNDNMEIIAKSTERFLRADGALGVVRRIHSQATRLIFEAGLTLDNISEIGVAVPGSIDINKGLVHDAFNLGFCDVPLRDMLYEAFGAHKIIRVINDADAAANAELRLGALYGRQTAVFLTLGTGVGGSLIIGGRLFCGGLGNGTEPGHMTLKYNGSKCSCGRRGCAETLCAASSLTIAAKRQRKIARSSPLYSMKNGKLTAKLVVEVAQRGIEPALRLFDEYIETLAAYIASLINLLDPEIVCIGGGMSNTGDFLLEKLKPRVYERCFFKKHAEIVIAYFKNDAGIIGAACEL
ncbi:MAG: ROK family protein [Clostridia bacterium]|nr:ROK family protein [Clostridia bacterium]